MKRFFDLTFRPFFVITGIETASASLYAFWPSWKSGNRRKNPVRAGLHDHHSTLGHHGGPKTPIENGSLQFRCRFGRQRIPARTSPPRPVPSVPGSGVELEAW